ncbi:rhamnosyltransferase [Halopseudomonas xinjiangensis]|uniref:Rhamnosyltransferase n=1 Tax=Halopseudomonas xinjiangensis TaxID=487184 RepID=A0A1H1NQH0_9GAMM|nr:glycosyltransferase [Halopseudomonas xinjiangensis]SDS00569.1 rhamnosyltransferase [Halopseudomonas xinjiangensis]
MTAWPEARVAVLLAAHQGRIWLPDQIQSILDQIGVSVTILISVDQSTDGTEAYVDHAALQHSNIRILPHGLKSGTAAANFFRLIRELDPEGFDYVAFADQDDLWDQDKLDRAIGQLRLRGADGYSGNVTAFWPDGREKLINKAQAQRRWDFLFEAAGPGCTYVMSRHLFEALQSFVSTRTGALGSVYLHDWFCYAFARANGFSWWIDPEPKMQYRQHQNNLVGVNQGWKARMGRFRHVSSGWWLDQARTIARLLGLESSAFVRSWIDPNKRSGYLVLVLNARNCRRKAIDAFFMSMMVLLLAIHPPSYETD